MRTLKEYIDFLLSKGYEEQDFYEYIDGCLTYVYLTKNDKSVTLQVDLDADIYNSIKVGEPIPTDPNLYEVVNVLIECPICNEMGFLDGGQTGIQLTKYASEEGYVPHGLDLFEKCIDIQENLAQHEMFIMERHIDNIKWLQENLHQFLIDHDYYVDYSSVFDCREKETSSPRIDYKHPNELKFETFTLYTDCITGDFIFVTKDVSRVKIRKIENLYDFIRQSEWMKDGELLEPFKYFEDEGWTKDSYKNVLAFYEDYQHHIWGNTYDLPPEYSELYQSYLNKIPLKSSINLKNKIYDKY